MKLIKFTTYDAQWTSDCKVLMIRSEAKELLINLEYIVTVSPKPLAAWGNSKRVDLYYVKTAIPTGRGINGVDYSSFYVTEETYQKIIENVEVLG